MLDERLLVGDDRMAQVEGRQVRLDQLLERLRVRRLYGDTDEHEAADRGAVGRGEVEGAAIDVDGHVAPAGERTVVLVRPLVVGAHEASTDPACSSVGLAHRR